VVQRFHEIRTEIKSLLNYVQHSIILEKYVELGLSGKVAIVTAATANIGRGIALELASEGVKLIAVGRDEDAGTKLVEAALERGASSATFVKADLLDRASPARICAAAEKHGPVEVLVNCLGGNVDQGLFADSDPEKWDKDIDLNFGTVLRMTHAVLPGMIERKGGSIVNIGSTAGLVGDYMLPVYSAMKGAVHSFSVVPTPLRLTRRSLRIRRLSAKEAALIPLMTFLLRTQQPSARKNRQSASAAHLSAGLSLRPRKCQA
jgi:NADP-dependent 3-hydroxy acid dehydrogenase YdfG